MAKYRILVVEDDMDVAELLLMFFEAQGYEIYHADTGQQGIMLARARLPNLIILDIMLPDMDGFSICGELRSKNLTKYIPTIFLTQRNAHSDKVSGLQLGADYYITKPFDVEELRVRVQKSISNATRDHLHEEITGLPTGPLIEAEYQSFLKSHAKWHRLDIHVAGYNAFRDAYGFLTANDALNLAAKTISSQVVEHGTNDDFVGVVENGYFVVFTFGTDFERIVRSAVSDFAERVKALYKFTDADQGYVILDEGLPSENKIPLMFLDISAQDSVAS